MAESNTLPSTVQSIGPPKFRILVLGKTGSGKSSLINAVFGVDVAQVSHRDPGKADIEGFEPADREQFDIVKAFIERRTETSSLERKLHAIWVCISIPLAGDRLIETGVEEICKMDRHNIPLVVIFTKYDRLVTQIIQETDISVFHKEDEIWLHGEKSADREFEKLCIRPLREVIPGVRLAKVSTQDRYRNTIEKLIQTTDEQLGIPHDSPSLAHTTPVPLAWAVAQRGNSSLSIEASINVGRKRYWKGLIASADFEGRKLRDCLEVIHNDIILVWNVKDPGNLVSSDEFKATMSKLVEHLIPDPQRSVSGKDVTPAVTALATSPSPFGIIIASLWSTVIFARWVQDIYRTTESIVACMMGYIVDLTIVMFKLSQIDSGASKETISSILQEFTSTEIMAVHHEIHEVVRSIGPAGREEILGKIILLIHKYCDPSL